MNRLSDRAAEFLQEQYRKTYDYHVKYIAMAFANILSNDKAQEPQYKDRYNESVYQEELIATMDWLHDKEINNKESMPIE